MHEDDFLRLLIVAAISAGQTPKDAIDTAMETVALMHVDRWHAPNDPGGE